MKTADDFKPYLPTSLKEIIVDELIDSNYEDWQQGKKVEPITDDAIEQLMQAVYAKIEKEALATYHSNEPWALKQWALSNILKDEVVNEATVNIAGELISPVIEWQDQSYNPVAKYKEKLIADGKPPNGPAEPGIATGCGSGVFILDNAVNGAFDLSSSAPYCACKAGVTIPSKLAV